MTDLINLTRRWRSARLLAVVAYRNSSLGFFAFSFADFKYCWSLLCRPATHKTSLATCFVVCRWQSVRTAGHQVQAPKTTCGLKGRRVRSNLAPQMLCCWMVSRLPVSGNRCNGLSSKKPRSASNQAEHVHANTCGPDESSLSPRLGPILLLRAETSLLVLPMVSFILTSSRLMVSLQASLTISTTTNPKDCRSSLAVYSVHTLMTYASAAGPAAAGPMHFNLSSRILGPRHL